MTLKSLLDEVGIVHRKSCSYVHQQMGIVERQDRHIVDSGIALLDQAHLPLWFYYAFTTTAFLYNRTNSKIFSDSLEKPQILNLFGCLAYPNLHPMQKSKFSDRLAPHTFIGYPKENRSYQLIDPITGKINVYNDVVFQEICFDQNRSLHHDNHGQTMTTPSPTVPILHSTNLVDSEINTTETAPTPPEIPTQSIDSTTSDSLNIEADSGSDILVEPPELPVSPRVHHMHQEQRLES